MGPQNVSSTKFCLAFSIMTVITIYNLYHQSNHNHTRYPKPLPLMETRNEFSRILRQERFQRAAEIGVQKGIFAEYLLSNWPECIEYHVIDLWQKQKNYLDQANVESAKQEKNYEETRQRLKKWDKIVVYHRNYSNIAVREIEDDSLDFIYIDARHDYTGVTEDMELYWPKLKYGGIYAGHDFLDVSEVPNQDWSVDRNGVHRKDGKAVKGAVIDFASKHNRQVLRTLHPSWPSWYLRK